jgi:hypothetical protein
MVTLKNIFKSVCDHISEVTNIPLVDSDLEEPVERPVFKIFMDTGKTGFYSSGLRQVKVYFNCYYYAKDQKHSKSEIYEIEDKLAFSFLEPFEIKEGCVTYIDDLEFEKVEDGILNCSFNFEIGTEFIDESALELMEELVINEE